MAKKQTRRSVSIRGTTYDRVRVFCERNSVSMSEFVEERIAAFFGEAPADKAELATRRLPQPPSPAPKAPAAQPPAPKAPPVAQAAPKQGKGNGNGDGDRLSFDQLHEAARFFTF